VNTLQQLVRAPRAAVEFANILLTTPDAQIGCSPREVVWTHRGTTLYRYRSSAREHAIPLLLVFALINRPEIFDLRPGNSFVEFLLSEGYDVFLVDWGVPDEEDADMGLAEYVCDELHWAVRETLRDSGSEELTLLGWCIGGTLCAMYCALHPEGPVRNAVLLTTPIDPSGSLYAKWVGGEDFDVDLIADSYAVVPGSGIDWANKLMKPVTNYLTTQRRLFMSVLEAGMYAPAPRPWRSGFQITRRSPPARTASGSHGCIRRTVSSTAGCACAGDASTFNGSNRTCSWSPPMPTTLLHQTALCRCSSLSPAKTSPIWTDQEVTSA